MTQTQDALDAMMGFDPSNTNPFNEEAPKVNPHVYKTNPKDSKSEDGIYRSKLRLIYNPYNWTKSLVSKTEWWLNGVGSITGLYDTKENRKVCPLFKASSTAFLALDGFAERFATTNYPGDGNKSKREMLLNEFNAVQGRGKEAWANKFKGTELGRQIIDYAKKTFDSTSSTWVIVQVLEDNNKPELVGQFKLMKLPKVILSKIQAKQYPTDEAKANGEKPVDLMSWVLGYPLKMAVKPGPDDPDHPERRQREISYDLCDFSTDFEPIRKVDGSQLFSDEELELLEEFATARKDAETAKSAKKREEAAKAIATGSDLYNKVREMTGKALKYLTEEEPVVDIVDEIEYKPWDAETEAKVQNWISEALLMNVTAIQNDSEPTVTDVDAESPSLVTGPVIEEGLPF